MTSVEEKDYEVHNAGGSLRLGRFHLLFSASLCEDSIIVIFWSRRTRQTKAKAPTDSYIKSVLCHVLLMNL